MDDSRVVIIGDGRYDIGHEIHLSRCVVIRQLIMGVLTKEDIIVTSEERRFLYKDIFDVVLNWDEYKKLDLAMYDILWYTNYGESVVSYRKRDADTLVNYYDNQFIQLCRKVQHVPIDDETDFVMVYHAYKSDTEQLNKVVSTIQKETGLRVIVFCGNKSVDGNFQKIDDYHTFVSYLHSPRCRLFIGGWSGLAQTAQYFSNTVVIFYGDQCDIYKNHIMLPNEIVETSLKYNINITNESWLSQNMRTHEILALDGDLSGPSWDFKTTSGCVRYYYDNIEEVLKNLSRDMLSTPYSSAPPNVDLVLSLGGKPLRVLLTGFDVNVLYYLFQEVMIHPGGTAMIVGRCDPRTKHLTRHYSNRITFVSKPSDSNFDIVYVFPDDKTKDWTPYLKKDGAIVHHTNL